MASRAFTTRFMRTCSIWPGSARTGPRLASIGDELDVLADQPPQHLLDLGHDRVQVQDPGLQHLLAAEGQELAGEPGRALGGLRDLVDVLVRRGIRRQLAAAAARCSR